MKKIIEGLTFESRVCKLSTFMSLKLLKLRWKIFFWTITGRIKKMHSRLQLTLSQGNPENILIIFILEAILPASEIYKQVRVYSDTPQTIFTLQESGLDIDHSFREIGKWIEFSISESRIP